MSNQVSKLILNLTLDPETNAEELSETTQQLRQELLEIDLDSVDFVSSGEAPSQTKSGDPITLGALLLTLAASGGVITTLINALQSWTTRHERHSVTLEIDGDKLEIHGISSDEQKQLISSWLARNSKKK